MTFYENLPEILSNLLSNLEIKNEYFYSKVVFSQNFSIIKSKSVFLPQMFHVGISICSKDGFLLKIYICREND